MKKYEKALEPFIKARGADWEIQIAEMDVSTSIFVLGNAELGN